MELASTPSKVQVPFHDTSIHFCFGFVFFPGVLSLYLPESHQCNTFSPSKKKQYFSGKNMLYRRICIGRLVYNVTNAIPLVEIFSYRPFLDLFFYVCHTMHNLNGTDTEAGS